MLISRKKGPEKRKLKVKSVGSDLCPAAFRIEILIK